VTLITVRHGGGVVERCGARCHNSKKPKCTCVCGGRFHGKRSDSRELFDAIKEHADELIAGLDSKKADVRRLRILAGLSALPDAWLKPATLFPLEAQRGESVKTEAEAGAAGQDG